MAQGRLLHEAHGRDQDGESSLLDHTLILAGASLADPNRHEHRNLPTILAGGLIKGGRHMMADKDTPMTNLMLSSWTCWMCRTMTSLATAPGRCPV